MEHGRAADRGLDLARYDAAYDGMFPFAVLTARAMGALSVRRLEQRNTRITLPGPPRRSAWRRSCWRATSAAASPRWRWPAWTSPRPKDRPPSSASPRRRPPRIDLSRTIAAMSSDKWFPGAPSGRIHIETAKRHGFRRRAVQALRHLAGRCQLPDDPGQGQGEPHAHAGRGLRAGAAVARPRRPVVAHGLQSMGIKDVGRFRLPWHGRTRARAS